MVTEHNLLWRSSVDWASALRTATTIPTIQRRGLPRRSRIKRQFKGNARHSWKPLLRHQADHLCPNYTLFWERSIKPSVHYSHPFVPQRWTLQTLAECVQISPGRPSKRSVNRCRSSSCNLSRYVINVNFRFRLQLLQILFPRTSLCNKRNGIIHMNILVVSRND